MATLVLTAPDISCANCKRNIESDLSGAPGVRDVSVDVQTKRVKIDFDDKLVDEASVRSALADSGYPPAP